MVTKKIHNILIFLSFFLPFILYFTTMAPTVSLWDCGEFISTSIIMGIPHPPGTPLYLIIGNFFSQIPILNDLGARVNIISPIASALSVMLLYYITVMFIEEYREKIAVVLSEPDTGIFDALNKGIRFATGDVIAILHSDDVFCDERVVSSMMARMSEMNAEFCFSDLVIMRLI